MLLLKGYSNSDTGILEQFDKTYQESTLIKSMKTNDKGFYKYAKVLSDKQMNNIINMVKAKIINARDDIINTQFNINPKVIDNKKIYANSYIDKIFEMLGRIFKEAIKQDYILKNPMLNVEKPKSDKLDEKIEAFTIEERNKLT